MLINHIGVSGGKDSTALLLWAVHESGYDPNSLDVTFCNTHNEHQITYDYIQMLSEKVWPITILEPELGFFELAKKKKRFPSAKARFCTIELKVKPTLRHIQALHEQGNEIRLHTGIRAGESFDRSKMVERGVDDKTWLEVYRPLLRWSLSDVWAIHEKYNIPKNPLYGLGCERVGCLPCVMSKKKEIARIAEFSPDTIARIRRAEDESIGPTGNRASFFMNKVPKRFRTKDCIQKNGKKIKVSGIDDVIRWAQTEKGAKQIMAGRDPLQPTFDFITRALSEFSGDNAGGCNTNIGMCE